MVAPNPQTHIDHKLGVLASYFTFRILLEGVGARCCAAWWSQCWISAFFLQCVNRTGFYLVFFFWTGEGPKVPRSFRYAHPLLISRKCKCKEWISWRSRRALLRPVVLPAFKSLCNGYVAGGIILQGETSEGMQSNISIFYNWQKKIFRADRWLWYYCTWQYIHFWYITYVFI